MAHGLDTRPFGLRIVNVTRVLAAGRPSGYVTVTCTSDASPAKAIAQSVGRSSKLARNAARMICEDFITHLARIKRGQTTLASRLTSRATKRPPDRPDLAARVACRVRPA